ncbi:MAG TPA: MBL fold metallo-hydrolase, partial [Bacteroidales bacterium]|nr:MBL fold metallo-hydrolase [Bacteroidales bacterium]
MQLPLFGQEPDGERLERIKKSPNYRDEQFHNQNTTPMLISKKGMFSILW